MKIVFEDRVWQFDMERITLKQAMAIQLHTGKSIAAWQDLLDVDELPDGTLADPGPEWLTGLQCVYWLMKNQNGDQFPIIDADFVIVDFTQAFAEGMQAEVDARKTAQAAQVTEPDPTQQTPGSPRSSPPGLGSPAPATRPGTTPPDRDPGRWEDVIA